MYNNALYRPLCPELDMEVGIRLCNCIADGLSLEGFTMKKFLANAPCTSRLVDADPTEEGEKGQAVPNQQNKTPLQPLSGPLPPELQPPRQKIHQSKQSL